MWVELIETFESEWDMFSSDFALPQPYEGLFLQTSLKQAEPHLPGEEPGVCLPDKLPGRGVCISFVCLM